MNFLQRQLNQVYVNELPFKPKNDGIRMRVYADGTQYIGKVLVESEGSSRSRTKKENDPFFNVYYKLALQAYDKLTREQKRDISRNGPKSKFACFMEEKILEMVVEDNEAYTEEYISDEIERKRQKASATRRRFLRKGYLNKWTFFCTFTNGQFESEKEFKEKLKKCLANYHTRHGWRYIGVWEKGDKTDRLHLHLVLYVPENGHIPGTFEEIKSYNFHKHRKLERNENSFFREAFGINDFQPISDFHAANGPVFEYMLKYCLKDEGDPFYGRGVPMEIEIDYVDGCVVLIVEVKGSKAYIMQRDLLVSEDVEIKFRN